MGAAFVFCGDETRFDPHTGTDSGLGATQAAEGGGMSEASELAAASGAVAAVEAEHAPTPVQLLASVTGGAPAPTLSASVVSLPDAEPAGSGLYRWQIVCSCSSILSD